MQTVPAENNSLAFTEDTVTVVTGSSRGLGLGFVKHILETTDSTVFATARKPQASEQLQALSKEHPNRLKLLTLDTEDEISIQAAADSVAAQVSGVDLLINNAGIDEGADKPILNLEGCEYKKILAVNVVGTFLTTKTFLPLLRKKHTRRVLQMSSGLGSVTINRLGMTNPEKNPAGNKWIGYTASKAALNMQTSVFANELKNDNFCIVCLDPGLVNTDMGGSNARKLGIESAASTVDESVTRVLKTMMQLGVKDSGRFLSRDGDNMPY